MYRLSIFALSSILVLLLTTAFAVVSSLNPHNFPTEIAQSIDILNKDRDNNMDKTSSSSLKTTRDYSSDFSDLMLRAYAAEAPEHDIELVLKRNTKHKKDIEESIFSSFKKLDETPQQVHLSVTEHRGNVSVMWTTSTASKASQVCHRIANTTSSSSSSPSSPPSSWTCEMGTAWTYHPITVIPWSGMIHKAHMTSLRPGARFEYYVEDPTLIEAEKENNNNNNKARSQTFSFIVPDLETKDEVTIALGGDMGTIQLMGWKVAKQMIMDFNSGLFNFDAFWLVGDIAYSTLDPPKLNMEFFWDMFLQQEQSLASRVPLLTSSGNHDASGGDWAAFSTRVQQAAVAQWIE